MNDCGRITGYTEVSWNRSRNVVFPTIGQQPIGCLEIWQVPSTTDKDLTSINL
jgi:hypothetical protein